MPKSFALALCLVAAGPVSGQTLLQDIAPGTQSGFRRPGGSFRGEFLFHGIGGLWISDGTEAGTELIYPSNAQLQDFVPFGGQLYFIGGDPLNKDSLNVYLWRTNGTTAGTEPVKYIGYNVGYRYMFRLGDELVIFVNSNELWRSDGSSEGTEMAFELPQGTVGYGTRFAEAGELLYFLPNNAVTQQLWRTDATEAGTFALLGADGIAATAADDLQAVGSRLAFVATTVAEGRELWVTDGTLQGTTIVADINPGSANSAPHDLAALDGGRLLFGASTGGSVQLWRSDLTAAGTQRVSLPVNYRTGLIGLGDEAFFFAIGNDVFGQQQLWRTDGTTAGSRYVTDVNSSLEELGPDEVRVGSDKHIVFRGNFTPNIFMQDPNGQSEPWYSDGTAEGTYNIGDIAPGVASSTPYFWGEAGGYLFFSANDGSTGWELYSVNIGELGSWSAASFGQPCSAANEPLVSLAGAATLGSAVALELDGAAASAPSTFYYSPFGGGLLASGCGFYVGLPQPLVGGVTDPIGSLSIPFTVPASLALIGVPLYFQSLTVAAGGPVLALAELSQGLEVVFGPQ